MCDVGGLGRGSVEYYGIDFSSAGSFISCFVCSVLFLRKHARTEADSGKRTCSDLGQCARAACGGPLMTKKKKAPASEKKKTDRGGAERRGLSVRREGGG